MSKEFKLFSGDPTREQKIAEMRSISKRGVRIQWIDQVNHIKTEAIRGIIIEEPFKVPPYQVIYKQGSSKKGKL